MKRFVIASAIISVAALMTLTYTGCEDDPSTGDLDSWFEDHPYVSDPRAEGGGGLSITPSSFAVGAIGDAVTFRVSGGNNSTYTWAQVTGAGTITPDGTGARDSALYTSTGLAENSVIVYDSDGRSAAALISVGDPATLQIVPSNATTVQPGGAIDIDFDGVGGVANYTWKVADNTIGTIDANTGAYDATAAGTNTIFCTDTVGTVATTTVKHP